MPQKTLQDISDEDLFAIQGVYMEMEPEFLTGDGELPRAVVQARLAQLHQRLDALHAKTGLAETDEIEVLDEWMRRGQPGLQPLLRS
jgi:hypothetical protein